MDEGSSPEIELRAAVGAGRPVRRGSGEPASEGARWGAERELPAHVLYELLCHPSSGSSSRAAVLVGLRVTGVLDFEDAVLCAPLIAHGCYFDEPVNLRGATASEIAFTACCLPAIDATQLKTRRDLDLSGSRLKLASLYGAHIGGDLVCLGTTLAGGPYPLQLGGGSLRPEESAAPAWMELALTAESMNVDGNVYCDGVNADKAVLLRGAHVVGQLSFAGATLDEGLIADGLRVGGNVACDRFGERDFSAKGEVSLRAARIGGQLSLDGAQLDEGLAADGMHVGLMSCSDGFRALGPVRLRGAQIARQLNFNDAMLSHGLAADDLCVGQDMSCGRRFHAEGVVNLLAAHIGGQLFFDGARLTKGLIGDRLQVAGNMPCLTDAETQRSFDAQGPVRLPYAHIAGFLAFNGATLTEGLMAKGLQVDGDMWCTDGFIARRKVMLDGARVAGQLSFDGAVLEGGFSAARLRIKGDMFAAKLTSAAVDLRNAHIDGYMVFDGATLANGLMADGLRVDTMMSCTKGFRAAGEVRLVGAHLGQIALNGTLVRLVADGLRVPLNMTFESQSVALGEVRLVRAHIGQVSLDGAIAHFTADGVRVDSSMSCTARFHAQAISLVGAHISEQLTLDGMTLAAGFHAHGLRVAGRLSFDGATLSGQDVALDLKGAQLDGDVSLRFAVAPIGKINLAGASIGKIVDSEETWPAALNVEGCAYRSATADEDRQPRPRSREGPAVRLRGAIRRPRAAGPPDVQRRLRWIRLAEDGRPNQSLPTPGTGYASQPYVHLATLYREEGRDADARRVGYASELRRSAQLGPAGKAWSAFLRWTVGYGYKPLRAVVLLSMLVLAGSMAFSRFHNHGDLDAVNGDHPQFVAIIYTLDRLIPVVSFGLRDAFNPGGAAQWWAFTYTLFGWMLTVAVLAGLNAVVRRD